MPSKSSGGSLITAASQTSGIPGLGGADTLGGKLTPDPNPLSVPGVKGSPSPSNDSPAGAFASAGNTALSGLDSANRLLTLAASPLIWSRALLIAGGGIVIILGFAALAAGTSAGQQAIAAGKKAAGTAATVAAVIPK